MSERDLYDTFQKMYKEGTTANGDRFSIMKRVRELIRRNSNVERLADEVSKPRREGRDGAPPMGAYFLIFELGDLLDAMKEKYGFE